jgi:hypothetical protein
MTRARDILTADLFAVPRPAPATPGTMDYRAAISHELSEMLRKAPANRDRFAIAADVSRLTGKDVSKWMLDGYTSECREQFNLPLYLVPALEVACESHALTTWLSNVRGARLLVGEEALHHDLSRLEQIRDQAEAAIRALKPRVRGRL